MQKMQYGLKALNLAERRFLFRRQKLLAVQLSANTVRRMKCLELLKVVCPVLGLFFNGLSDKFCFKAAPQIQQNSKKNLILFVYSIFKKIDNISYDYF